MPGNLPFSVALAVVLLLGALEALSLLVGGASSLLDAHGPDLHLPDAHGLEVHAPGVHGGAHGLDAHSGVAHADADLDAGPMSDALTWLHAGQIPSTILLLLFLLGFGIGGLMLQSLMQSRFGTLLPSGVAVWPAGIIALLATRISGGLLKPVLPRDETEAVSQDSFVGCGGQITIGTARPGKPAEARVKDRFGRTHYVMVEPDGNDEFPAGSHVLLIKRHAALYRAIDNTGAQIDDL